MIRSTLVTAILLFSSLTLKAQSVFTQHEQNQTPTYHQVITEYERLAAQFEHAKLVEYGPTDSGEPLHAFIISTSGEFDPAMAQESGKTVLMINNGIHPGEPAGINASLILSHNLLNQSIEGPNHLENVILVIVPLYNIGGALNRNCCSRTNQMGPEMYGFRGNARNLDLDRDFIKMDALNSFALAGIFHDWEPDIFIDTHTTNGADYQYPMTLIATQHSKLQPDLAHLLNSSMLPFLYDYMEQSGHVMTPYVASVGETPEAGIAGFLDVPRYSSGYGALFNSLSFISEAHMLKPFQERVEATLSLLKGMLAYGSTHAEEIEQTREKAITETITREKFPIRWELDTTRVDSISFKGYQAGHKKSDVSGKQRLFYDRSQPFTRKIPYYNYYVATDTVQKPAYYIVPQAWRHTIARLQANDVQMKRLKNDTTLQTQTYYIGEFETVDQPYEGHYLHKGVTLTPIEMERHFYKGDYVVPVNQKANQYLIEVLEPKSVDSFFNWNFYDSMLQQKEYFSPYVFEDEAARLLANDDSLRAALKRKKANNTDFAQSSYQQLAYIYRHSAHYERTHRQYPIARIMQEIELPVK